MAVDVTIESCARGGEGRWRPAPDDLRPDPESIPCSFCNALPGQPCRSIAAGHEVGPHVSRLLATGRTEDECRTLTAVLLR